MYTRDAVMIGDPASVGLAGLGNSYISKITKHTAKYDRAIAKLESQAAANPAKAAALAPKIAAAKAAKAKGIAAIEKKYGHLNPAKQVADQAFPAPAPAGVMQQVTAPAGGIPTHFPPGRDPLKPPQALTPFQQAAIAAGGQIVNIAGKKKALFSASPAKAGDEWGVRLPADTAKMLQTAGKKLKAQYRETQKAAKQYGVPASAVTPPLWQGWEREHPQQFAMKAIAARYLTNESAAPALAPAPAPAPVLAPAPAPAPPMQSPNEERLWAGGSQWWAENHGRPAPPMREAGANVNPYMGNGSDPYADIFDLNSGFAKDPAPVMYPVRPEPAPAPALSLWDSAGYYSQYPSAPVADPYAGTYDPYSYTAAAWDVDSYYNQFQPFQTDYASADPYANWGYYDDPYTLQGLGFLKNVGKFFSGVAKSLPSIGMTAFSSALPVVGQALVGGVMQAIDPQGRLVQVRPTGQQAANAQPPAGAPIIVPVSAPTAPAASSLPAWVIPAMIGVAAVALLRK